MKIISAVGSVNETQTQKALLAIAVSLSGSRAIARTVIAEIPKSVAKPSSEKRTSAARMPPYWSTDR